MKVYLTLRVTWRGKSRRTQMPACQSGLSHAGVRGHALDDVVWTNLPE